MTHRTGLRVLQATVGVEADARALLLPFPLKIEVPSLLTDFRDVEEIPFPVRPDGRISLHGTTGGDIEYSFRNGQAVFRGPLRRFERSASDARFGLWGNQGFFYRFVLVPPRAPARRFQLPRLRALRREEPSTLRRRRRRRKRQDGLPLERDRQRLDASSRPRPSISGSAGRGLAWFKGSLVDNVRLGTLVHDFPMFCPPEFAGLAGDEVWRRKIALDLGDRQTPGDTLLSPAVVLIFPHIEEGRPGLTVTRIEDKRAAAKAVVRQHQPEDRRKRSPLRPSRRPRPGYGPPGGRAARCRPPARRAPDDRIDLVGPVQPRRMLGRFLKESFMSHPSNHPRPPQSLGRRHPDARPGPDGETPVLRPDHGHRQDPRSPPARGPARPRGRLHRRHQADLRDLRVLCRRPSPGQNGTGPGRGRRDHARRHVP